MNEANSHQGLLTIVASALLAWSTASCSNEDIEVLEPPHVVWNAQFSLEPGLDYAAPWIWIATGPSSISTDELYCLMRLPADGSGLYSSFERRVAEKSYRIESIPDLPEGPYIVGGNVLQAPDNQVRDWRIVVVALVDPGEQPNEFWFGDATFEADEEFGPSEGCGRQRCLAGGPLDPPLQIAIDEPGFDCAED